MSLALQPTLTLSPTGTWQSSPVSVSTDGLLLYLTVTAIASGQSVSVRLVALDPYGNAYYFGAARAAQSATGQYLYVVKPGAADVGGAIPSDGLIALPAPETVVVQLAFGDTGGSKPVTFSLALGEKA